MIGRAQPANRQSGVTLIELLIGIAIVSLMLTTVAPSVREILIQNRIIGQINELSAVVQFARHTAINDQVTSVLCPTQNFATCTLDWNDPKMVFPDVNNDGIRGLGEDLLVGTGNIVDTNNLSGPAGVISFQANGSVASPTTLLLCHQENEDRFARALIISLQGRVKMSQDSNNDGVHENNSGVALDCGS